MKNFLILILALVFLPVLSQAAGIQVSPSKVDLVLEENKSASKELIVANPTADVQIFEVYPDEFPEIIKANPASFTLEAGGRKTVIVTAYPAITENVSQILKTNLSVVGKPLVETRLQANTGVKIPLSIIIEYVAIETASNNKISPRLFYAILIVVALGFGSITHLILKRNKKRNNYPNNYPKLEN
ncbi:MAG: hypothetical protein KAU07_01960 [Candidatus Andersenbacteria bacterium]|nr:hypothetical protein [Candidatus Andersenbacteria bacterium]